MLNDDEAHRNAKAIVIHPWWHKVSYAVIFLILAVFTFLVLTDLISRVNSAEDRVDRADARVDTTLQAVQALNNQIEDLGATPVVTPSDLPQPAQDGRDGAPGSPGPTGPAGPSGAPGRNGVNGVSLPGATGASGAPGAAGASGAPGASVTGAAGVKGDKGDKGDTGEAGATGAQGEPGAQGPQGIQGPAGPPVGSFTFQMPLVGTYTCVDPDGDNAYDCTLDAPAPINAPRPNTTKIVKRN